MQREEPYQGLTCIVFFRNGKVLSFYERKNYNTGGAWLSSARALTCMVKSCNERNPRL